MGALIFVVLFVVGGVPTVSQKLNPGASGAASVQFRIPSTPWMPLLVEKLFLPLVERPFAAPAPCGATDGNIFCAPFKKLRGTRWLLFPADELGLAEAAAAGTPARITRATITAARVNKRRCLIPSPFSNRDGRRCTR
jgi:hypothetical protein